MAWLTPEQRAAKQRGFNQNRAWIRILRKRPKDMRYPTVGDWLPGGCTVYDGVSIHVVDMGHPDYNFLTAFHELIEWYLCSVAGIREEAVTEWDEAHPDCEPGALVEAPYYVQHMVAEDFERALAKKLGVDWVEYDRAVNKAMLAVENFHVSPDGVARRNARAHKKPTTVGRKKVWLPTVKQMDLKSRTMEPQKRRSWPTMRSLEQKERALKHKGKRMTALEKLEHLQAQINNPPG